MRKNKIERREKGNRAKKKKKKARKREITADVTFNNSMG